MGREGLADVMRRDVWRSCGGGIRWLAPGVAEAEGVGWCSLSCYARKKTGEVESGRVGRYGY
jgi:hypothetical protein